MALYTIIKGQEASEASTHRGYEWEMYRKDQLIQAQYRACSEDPWVILPALANEDLGLQMLFAQIERDQDLVATRERVIMEEMRWREGQDLMKELAEMVQKGPRWDEEEAQQAFNCAPEPRRRLKAGKMSKREEAELLRDRIKAAMLYGKAQRHLIDDLLEEIVALVVES